MSTIQRKVSMQKIYIKERSNLKGERPLMQKNLMIKEKKEKFVMKISWMQGMKKIIQLMKNKKSLQLKKVKEINIIFLFKE